MNTGLCAVLLCSALTSAEALAGSPCEISLGLYLGAQAGPLALADDALETLAAIALLGQDDDLLALSASRNLGTTVRFDGAHLRIVVEGSCEAAADLQHRRLDQLLQSHPDRPRILPRADALAGLRSSLAAARVAHLARGEKAPLGASDAHSLIQTVLASSPLFVETAPPSLAATLRARVLDGISQTRIRPVPSASPPISRRPGPIALPPSRDGLGRLWLVFQAPPALGPVLATLLSHPGFELTHHLREQHGLVESLAGTWFPALETLVLSVSIASDDIRSARDQLFAELSTLELSPEAISGAIALSPPYSASAPNIERALRETLVPANAAIVYALPRADDAYPIIDADLIAHWAAAQVDMRCPPPGETRPLAEILHEHGLEPDRFLLLTRILGRDRDRMADLDRELADRCNEFEKLRRLMPPKRLFALHRDIACAPSTPRSEDDERSRREALCRKAGIDLSAYPPLLSMARREPALRQEIARIDSACGIRP